MKIIDDLNKTLLEQNFSDEAEDISALNAAKAIAQVYANVEQSIAVLSDLKTNVSYIFKGLIAERLGLSRSGTEEIDSIWEKAIFNRIHPNHLLKKYQFEIQFFQFLKTIPIEKRSNYCVIQNISMLNQFEEYINILFRMFYIGNHSNGSVQHALCLYNLHPAPDKMNDFEGIIMNLATGDRVVLDDESSENILTHREKEILNLIDKGFASKIIAGELSISIHTVNRHRQNILEKLRASNSVEACRLAKSIGII